ncbi:hypothetical protein BDP27DRAFT_1449062 [Rhodocollybia butyracea]|uniref:Uncharacterized protein n=1 Tax=Rhodocollybia butyracea TaxID=206335 RepID=A0A9P5PQ98_9AGAR|nr:hypothetical protein BDP27DRAFT_1449062 [Rhodocollybia butyracea]
MSKNKVGRPQKRKRNISGLKNQSKRSSSDESAQQLRKDVGLNVDVEGSPGSKNRLAVTFEGSAVPNGEGDCREEDTARIAVSFEEESNKSEGAREESDMEERKDIFPGESLQAASFDYTAAIDTDIHDEDWVLEGSRRKKLRREREQKERPKTYATGPDISRKSARSQLRYKKQRKGQESLTTFGSSGGNRTVLGLRARDNPADCELCVPIQPGVH